MLYTLSWLCYHEDKLVMERKGENQKDIIGQYVMFCKVVDREIKTHGYSRKTIENAIKICQDRNVLVEYLEKRKCEVMDPIWVHFNTLLEVVVEDSKIIKEAMIYAH